MGRPKKTINDLPDNWQEIADTMYSEGASDVEVYVALGIWGQLFYRLVDEDEIFSNTIKRGREKSQAWWEKSGRINLGNKDFSSTLWYMNMKNRFGWRDKQELTGKDGEAIKVHFVAPSLIDQETWDKQS